MRGISLRVDEGEAIAIVGESGSGKSTVLNAILGLLPRDARVDGAIEIAGQRVERLGERALRRLRGRRVGLVPQSPFDALEPLRTVQHHVRSAARAHGVRLRAGAVRERLEALEIPPAEARRRAYPHEWSGGMLQRACIAAAIAHRPPLILADEPTSALDAEIAVGVLRTIREHAPALVVVTHDVAVARTVATEVHVMYAGRVVEHGPVGRVLERPRHPYAQALIAAVPRPGDPLPQELAGEPPDLAETIVGCAFRARCGAARPACAEAEPALVDGVACHAIGAAAR